MSEEKKNQAPEETPETEAQTAPEAEQEEKAPEQEEQKPKKKEKKYTLTREQMEQMELAVQQLSAAKDQYTRLAAEYDNYRKRTTREKETIYQDAKGDTIAKFLAVYDNLERALKSDEDSDSPHKKGMEMIFAQFKGILEAMGVTEIPALGQPFDPERHNAVMHIEDESLGENVVADVFQAGFMLGDKVLRFATVRVAN